MNLGKWLGRGVVGVALLGIMPLAGADDSDSMIAPPGAVLGRTIPSHLAKPSFMEVGIVKHWLVKPGDVVKKGQVLGIEDTDLEKLKLRTLEIQAKSSAAVDAATADRDSKKIEFDRKSQLGADATGTELEEAKLDYEEKEAELRNAQMEHEKQLSDVDSQTGMIEKMQLLSPADGIVKEISIQEGEVVDPNKPDGALTLVTNNPLWVEAAVPSDTALKLKVGDDALVSYKDEPENWLKAKVIFLDPEVTSGSNTETVRVELSNDENKVSGLWANVRFPGVPDTAGAVGSAK